MSLLCVMFSWLYTRAVHFVVPRNVLPQVSRPPMGGPHVPRLVGFLLAVRVLTYRILESDCTETKVLHVFSVLLSLSLSLLDFRAVTNQERSEPQLHNRWPPLRRVRHYDGCRVNKHRV